MSWLGLDIGGANIKAASSDGKILSVPFRFWVDLDRLNETLTGLLRQFPGMKVAATMTAELADCFDSRRQGVHHIVDCLSTVCDQLGIEPPIFAGTDAQFRDAESAKTQWLVTAASNWAMLSKYAGRYLPQQTGLVIDLGSTTTDVIPVKDGVVVAKGKTDSERLRNAELVYVGADRTPVCSLVSEFQYKGETTPIAREFFATVADAMLVAGIVKENTQDRDTADGRPRTIQCAAQRLCRMVCEDVETLGLKVAEQLANSVLHQIQHLLHEAVARADSELRAHIVVTGSGSAFAYERLAKTFPDSNVQRLSSFERDIVDVAAPAYAVAVLASERAGL